MRTTFTFLRLAGHWTIYVSKFLPWWRLSLINSLFGVYLFLLIIFVCDSIKFHGTCLYLHLDGKILNSLIVIKNNKNNIYLLFTILNLENSTDITEFPHQCTKDTPQPRVTKSQVLQGRYYGKTSKDIFHNF